MRSLRPKIVAPRDSQAAGPRLVDRLPTLDELRPLLERELRRARRYHRSFGLLVLRLPATTGRELRARRLHEVGSLLQDGLRETDLIGEDVEEGEIAALLPEADAHAAVSGCMHRIRHLLEPENGWGLVAGAATYPADGITLDELLRHARRSPLGAAASGTPVRSRRRANMNA